MSIKKYLDDNLSSAEWRKLFDSAFSAETAYKGSWDPNVPSKGHCAAVALIIYDLYGGELVSAVVNGQSHWYNHLPSGIYIDFTADQFSGDKVKTSYNPIYEDTRVRTESEVSVETRVRSENLAAKIIANMTNIDRKKKMKNKIVNIVLVLALTAIIGGALGWLWYRLATYHEPRKYTPTTLCVNVTCPTNTYYIIFDKESGRYKRSGWTYENQPLEICLDIAVENEFFVAYKHDCRWTVTHEPNNENN